ncbi:MAG: mandelate racemase/muconate lactonizing enzyme family protein [Acidobacteriota bacterium]
MKLNRRDLLKMAPGVPAAWLLNYRALAAPFTKMVKITAVKTLGIDNTGDSCLVKIETDAGLSGYGEAGFSAPAARAIIEIMKPILIGQDPLAIERHFYMMTETQHPHKAHIPTIGGVDMALWDLAGKILGLPVYRLLGGPLQKEIPIYGHGTIANMLDKGECRAWADRVKSEPEGMTAFKFTAVGGRGGAPRPRNATGGNAAFGELFRRPGKGGFPHSTTLDGEDFRNAAKGYMNLREAVGDSLDIAMHCLAQFDTRSAIGLCKAIEPADPAWIEDPLPTLYSEAWLELKRSTRVPILTGERVELVAGFRPYLDNQVVDVIHPDPAYAGGITACRDIAKYASLTRTHVGFHSGPSSLVQFYAALHLASATPNLFKIENVLGAFRGNKEDMAQGVKPAVRKGVIAVPEGPGLGLEINEDWLKSHMEKGETWWG